MIIAGVEFKSEYLKYYYKWLEIVELEHNEEVFLLYLKDCFKSRFPGELDIFENNSFIYECSEHRMYFNNKEYVDIEYLLSIGHRLIKEYEDFRDRST